MDAENYILRSVHEAALSKIERERDVLRDSVDVMHDEVRDAYSRMEASRARAEQADAADAASKEANARADAHAETARAATQALADERASRAEEVDGKLRDHLAPIHMALTKLADMKHGTDEGVLAGLTSAVNALSTHMNKVEAPPMAQFELEHIRDGDDRISRTKVRQVQ